MTRTTRLALASVLLTTGLWACGDDDGGHANQNGNQPLPVCGNGILELGEQCDDGAANSDVAPDACRTDCARARCGDGVVDADEDCDLDALSGQTCTTLGQGYTGGDLACDVRCRLDERGCATCGNGIAEAGEACDGTDLGGENCSSAATKQHGVVVCQEGCTLDTSGCYTCGDGFREDPEECDGEDLAGATCLSVGYDSGDLRCSFLCVYDPRDCGSCGNLILEPGETCDDGNGAAFDGCDGCQPAELRLNDTVQSHQWYPAIAAHATGQLAVVWHGSVLGGGGVGLRLFGADGLPLGPELRASSGTDSAIFPVVAARQWSALVAWTSLEGAAGYLQGGDGIRARLWTTTGFAMWNTGNTQVNLTTQGIQRWPAVAASDALGFHIVAWESQNVDGNGFGIVLRRFVEQQSGGQLVGTPELPVNQTTVGDQRRPAVAVAEDGTFVVVWQGPGLDGTDVWARRFASDATALGDEVLVNQTTAGEQITPTVSMNATGEVLVTWASENADGDGFGVVTRRLAADLSPLGDEILVNGITLGDQGYVATSPLLGGPEAALAADGSFVATWAGPDDDGQNSYPYVRRFDAGDVPVGPEWCPGRYGGGGGARLVVLPDGRAASTWMSWFAGSEYDVMFQRLGADDQLYGSLPW